MLIVSVARAEASLPRGGGEELTPHRFQLTTNAGVNEFVADAEDQAADDRVVDVLLNDGVLLQGRADPLADLFELGGRELLGDGDVDLDLAQELVEELVVRGGDLVEQAEA